MALDAADVAALAPSSRLGGHRQPDGALPPERKKKKKKKAKPKEMAASASASASASTNAVPRTPYQILARFIEREAKDAGKGPGRVNKEFDADEASARIAQYGASREVKPTEFQALLAQAISSGCQMMLDELWEWCDTGENDGFERYEVFGRLVIDDCL